ncbi:MAG: ribokinase [Clostridiaceae bacterium]
MTEKKPKILVVGSFVMDQIVTTSVFPQQGETVLANTFQRAPGGKGANQAVQAARLGADVAMLGKLGDDANAKEMLAVCKGDGIDVSRTVYDPAVSSGCSMIILEKCPGGNTKNRILVVPGTNMLLTIEDISFLENAIDQYDLVMLQLEIPMQVNESVAQYAYKKHVPVMLNPAPSDSLSDKLLARLTYISPNEHEAEALTGINIRHNDGQADMERTRAAAEMLRNKGVPNVLITLGDAGAALLNNDGFFYQPCADNVTAVDPTAAGDSFVSAFCVGACYGWNAAETLHFATHTAALTVSAMGAMPSLPRRHEVEQFMRQRGLYVPGTPNA